MLMSVVPCGKEVKKGVHSVLLPLFLQTVTVTEVPPGFPLQTHFCFFRFILFLSLLLSYFLSKQTHVFVFCLFFLFLVGLFFQDSAKASYVPPPLLPFVPYSRVNYFNEIFLSSLLFPHDCWIYSVAVCILFLFSYDFLSFIFIIF